MIKVLGINDYVAVVQFDEQASQLCSSASAGSCASWRQAVGCNATGDRDPLQDRPCDVEVQTSQAGYCECENSENYPVDCDHQPFTCDDKCNEVTTKNELIPCGRMVKATKITKQALNVS